MRSSAVAAGLQFTTVFGAASNLVYAYAGMWMYHEMMAEMEAPADFPKAFAVSGPIMVSLYLLVAFLVTPTHTLASSGERDIFIAGSQRIHLRFAAL